MWLSHVMKCYFEASGIVVLGLGRMPMAIKVQHNSLYSEIQGKWTCTLEVDLPNPGKYSVYIGLGGMVYLLNHNTIRCCHDHTLAETSRN